MSHLGERLTALVDGELSHAERDRALAHLTGCAACRDQADDLREVKRRLRTLAGHDPRDPVPVGPPADLLARLSAIGEPSTGPDGVRPTAAARPAAETPPAAGRRRPVRPNPMVEPEPAAGAWPHSVPARHWPRPAAPALLAARPPSSRRLAVGAAALAIGISTASFLAGADAQRSPRVTPAFDRLELEHALVSGDVPFRSPSPELTPRP